MKDAGGVGGGEGVGDLREQRRPRAPRQRRLRRRQVAREVGAAQELEAQKRGVVVDAGVERAHHVRVLAFVLRICRPTPRGGAANCTVPSGGSASAMTVPMKLLNSAHVSTSKPCQLAVATLGSSLSRVATKPLRLGPTLTLVNADT